MEEACLDIEVLDVPAQSRGKMEVGTERLELCSGGDRLRKVNAGLLGITLHNREGRRRD